MHELSIAMNIVDLAQEESQNRGGLHVRAVHLRLGALAGVAKELLLSSYEMACHDTPLAGSQLVIEELPGMLYCPNCAQTRLVRGSEWFCCSVCGAIASKIVQGKELELVALEVVE